MYRNHRVAKETHPNWREAVEPLPVRIIDKNLEATEYIYLTVSASKPAAIKTEVSIIFTRYRLDTNKNNKTELFYPPINFQTSKICVLPFAIVCLIRATEHDSDPAPEPILLQNRSLQKNGYPENKRKSRFNRFSTR